MEVANERSGIRGQEHEGDHTGVARAKRTTRDSPRWRRTRGVGRNAWGVVHGKMGVGERVGDSLSTLTSRGPTVWDGAVVVRADLRAARTAADATLGSVAQALSLAFYRFRVCEDWGWKGEVVGKKKRSEGGEREEAKPGSARRRSGRGEGGLGGVPPAAGTGRMRTGRGFGGRDADKKEWGRETLFGWCGVPKG